MKPADPVGNFRALAEGPDGMSHDEAILAYTAGSAYAEFADHEKGCIVPGQLADLVAWNSNDQVVLTMLDGDIIFHSEHV